MENSTRQSNFRNGNHITTEGEPASNGIGIVEFGRPYETLPYIESASEYIAENFRSRGIIQPEAIEAIMKTLDAAPNRDRRGNSDRPKAIFLFMGPTGVGKTVTAHVLAEMLNGDADPNLLEVYGSTSDVTNLIGTRPKPNETGITPQFRPSTIERPGSVLLFEGIEKASSQVYDLMMQITDKGKITNNLGEEVSFKDVIVIMTSSIAWEEISESSLGFVRDTDSTAKKLDRTQLETIASKVADRRFSDKFINHIDKLVVFNTFDADNLTGVLNATINEMDRQLELDKGVSIQLSPETSAYLVGQAAKEPSLGATPLIKEITEQIVTPIGRYLESGILNEGDEVLISVRAETGDEHDQPSKSPLDFRVRSRPFFQKRTEEVNFEKIRNVVPDELASLEAV